MRDIFLLGARFCVAAGRLCRTYGAGIWEGDGPGLRPGQDYCAVPRLQWGRGLRSLPKARVGDEERSCWPIWRWALQSADQAVEKGG